MYEYCISDGAVFFGAYEACSRRSNKNFHAENKVFRNGQQLKA